MSVRKAVFVVVVAGLLIATAYAGDPPARVARLNYISGQVSIQPNGVEEWVAGSINRPLTSSDRVWADKDSRAELQLGGGALRLNSETSLTLVNVSDNNVQVELDQGTLNLHVVELFDGEIYEVDTPNLAFVVRKSGDYRFDVDNAGDTTVVTAFKGEGDVTGDGPAVRVRKGEQYTFRNGRSLLYAYTDAPGRDGFDDWCRVRADREDRSVAARYVSRYTVGYEDLDDYGYWETAAVYGSIWYPRHVVVGWAPYRYGHWIWVSPWGWTWVDDAPWGFAPFHYGRWVYYHNRWGWCPGPRHYRPYYAPALVGWFGGSHWGVGVSFGVGGGVGWFPLGWGEPYIPYYGHSRGYFQHVNISNTRITNITYITNNYYDHHRSIANIHYVNRNNGGAVTAVSTEVFRTGRPTRDAIVHVSAADMKRASLEREVRVNPTANSVLGVNAGERRAVPPERLIARPGRANAPDRANSVAGAQPSRETRPSAGVTPGRERGVSENAGISANPGRGTRGVPRPPDRSNQVSTAENERPSDVPRPGRDANGGNEARTSMPSRVPRPPDRQLPDSLKTDSVYPNRGSRSVDRAANPTAERTPTIGSDTRPTRTVPRPPEGQTVRQDRTDQVDRAMNNNRVQRTDRATTTPNVDRSVPRPSDGQVVRQERPTPNVNRDVRSAGPSVREERPVSRAPEVSRPPAPQAPARTEAPKQSAPAHPSRPESRPSRENKSEQQKNGGQAGLRSYPSPYNSFTSTANVRPASYRQSSSNSYPSYSQYRAVPMNREPIARSSYSSRPYSNYSSARPTYSARPDYSGRTYSSSARSSYSPRSYSSYSGGARYSAPSHSSSYSHSVSRGSSHSYSSSRAASSGGHRSSR